AIAAGLFVFHLLRPGPEINVNESESTSNAQLPIVQNGIAVLPFANLSSDKENAYFADGIQDEILTKLAHIAGLKVISRTSTAKYKSKPEDLRAVAQQLGVAHILEGSVQRAADKVHVNVQLLDARADAHLWAESYDRELKDVFAVESEVSQKVANSLQAKLSPAEKNTIEQRPTADVVAFEQYSKAKTLMLIEGEGELQDRAYREAIGLLKSAIARDP